MILLARPAAVAFMLASIAALATGTAAQTQARPEDAVACLNGRAGSGHESCRHATEAGHAESAYILAFLLDYGHGVRQSVMSAIVWYRRSAEAGSTDATVRLAQIFEEGRETQSEDVAALGWYRRAAEADHPHAIYILGANLRDGVGARREAAEAKRWFERSLAAGYEPAREEPAKSRTNQLR